MRPPTTHQQASTFQAVPARRRLFLVLFGTMLSLVAGYINGVSVAPISHVTGATTNAGLSIGRGEWGAAAVYGALIATYLLGATISGVIVGDMRFRWSRRYGWVLILESLFICMAYRDYETPLVQSAGLPFTRGSLWASLACGLQNACTTTFSGAVVRTTHVTGLITDLGTILGQMLFWRDLRSKNLWKVAVLVPLFAGFMSGGVLAFFAFAALGKMSLLLVALPLFLLGLAHAVYRAARRWQKLQLLTMAHSGWRAKDSFSGLSGRLRQFWTYEEPHATGEEDDAALIDGRAAESTPLLLPR